MKNRDELTQQIEFRLRNSRPPRRPSTAARIAALFFGLVASACIVAMIALIVVVLSALSGGTLTWLALVVYVLLFIVAGWLGLVCFLVAMAVWSEA